MESNTAFSFETIYNSMNDGIKDSTAKLLQSFTLNNNADIIKAIEYFEKKKGKVSERDKENLSEIINRLENIMVLRLRHTEDLWSSELPVSYGPMPKSSMVPANIQEAEIIEDKEETKVVEHPASKGKKKEETKEEKKEEVIPMGEGKKQQTINEKLGESEIAKKNRLRFWELLEKYLITQKNEDKARLIITTRYPKASEVQVQRLMQWVKNDNFRARSPMDVMENQPLSISDLVDETRRLIHEDGLGEDEIKNWVRTQVFGIQLKEQEESDIIRTEEGYEKFFRSVIQFLFNDDQFEQDANRIKKPKDTRKEFKELLYAKYQSFGKEAIPKMARELKSKFHKEDKNYNLQNALAEISEFVKSVDSKLLDEYNKSKSEKSNSGSKESKHDKDTKPEQNKKQDKTTTSKSDNSDKSNIKTEEKKVEKKEEPKDAKVEEKKTSTVEKFKKVIKSKFPKHEELLKFQTNEANLINYLISISNKKREIIGTFPNMDKIIEGLTHLAQKQILEGNMDDDKFNDWKEADVSNWMAENIVPYITDYYAILRSENEEELKQHLMFYTQNFKAGEEEQRRKKVKEVCESDIARSNFMKKFAKKVKKGNFNEVNTLFQEINSEELEKVKQTKTK